MSKRVLFDQSSSTPQKKIKQDASQQAKCTLMKQTVKTFTFEEIAARENDDSCLNQHVAFRNTLPLFGVPPEVGVMEVNTNYYKMVLRKESLELFNKIDKWTHNFKECGIIQSMGLALWGSGGVGKSVLLYLLAQYCRAKEWIVIYFPTAPPTTEARIDQIWCQNMIAVIQEYYGHEQIGKETVYQACENITNDPSTTLKEVIQKLSSRASKPVLVALDQWNLLIRENGDRKGDCFVNYFSSFESVGNNSRGVFICALSSQATSALPRSAFRDANRQNTRIIVNPYNTQGFNSHLHLMQTIGKLPDKISIENFEMIRYETACIPRLVSWMIGNNLDVSEFSKRAVDYYSKRVESCLTRHIDKNVADIAASIFLNKVVEAPDINWIHQGVLVPFEDDGYDAPCPSARRAILHVMNTKFRDMLDILLGDSKFRERALELLFLQAFANHVKPVTRVVSFDNQDLNLGVRSVYYQPAPRMKTYEHFNIEKGTLVICHDYHGIIDFVIRTFEDNLVFIQVSNSSYGDHKPHTEELFSKKIKYKQGDQEAKATMYNYYCLCAGRQEVKEGVSGHSSTFVFYLTPSSEESRKVRGITILNKQDQWASLVDSQNAARVFE